MSSVRVPLSWRSTGDGSPVLMLPPAATSGEVWHTHQVPALTAAGYRVVTANLRGMPPSPVTAGPYRMADLAGDVAALIEEIGAGPCHLVGASLGAMVSQEVTLARPDLVRSATLIGTRASTDSFRRRLARATAAHTRTSSTVSEFEALGHLARLFGPATLADDQQVADWTDLLCRFPVTGPGPAAQYEASVVTDRHEALAAIRRPCLVIAFGADVITPPGAGRDVHRAIPSSSFVELPGLGHFGFLEDPEAVNAALLAFLDAQPGRVPAAAATQ